MNKSMYFLLSALVAGFILWTAFQETTREDQDHQIEIAVAENIQLFIQEKTLECESRAHQEATTRAMARLAEMGRPMPAPAPRPARPATIEETKPAIETPAQIEERKDEEPARTRTGAQRQDAEEGTRTRSGASRVDDDQKKEEDQPRQRTRTGAGGGGE